MFSVKPPSPQEISDGVNHAIRRYAARARQTQGTDEGDVAGCLRDLLDDPALAEARGSANRLVLAEVGTAHREVVG